MTVFSSPVMLSPDGATPEEALIEFVQGRAGDLRAAVVLTVLLAPRCLRQGLNDGALLLWLAVCSASPQSSSDATNGSDSTHAALKRCVAQLRTQNPSASDQAIMQACQSQIGGSGTPKQ
jgi:hypothetical protein